MAIKVTLHRIDGAGPKQKEFADEAVRLLGLAINHPRFASLVRAATFAAWHDDHEQEVSVAEVLNIIETGRELKTGADYELDLYVRLLRLRRRTVGWTDVGGPVITTAYWYINQCIRAQDPADLAAHWMHEWLHVAGFYHHEGNRTRGDVPYVIGQLVYDLLGQIPETAPHHDAF